MLRHLKFQDTSFDGGGLLIPTVAALGMRVIGIDPRVTGAPLSMSDLAGPDKLEARLGEGFAKEKWF